MKGVEPPRLSALEPKSRASTSSATSALAAKSHAAIILSISRPARSAKAARAKRVENSAARMTKGVSIVTGQDDPLPADVVRSRKNKDLLTFTARFERTKSPIGRRPPGLARSTRTQKPLRHEYSGRLNGRKPLQDAGFLETKVLTMQVTETLNSGLKREIKVTVPAGDMEAKLMARLNDAKAKVRINGFPPRQGADPASAQGLRQVVHGRGGQRDPVQLDAPHHRRSRRKGRHAARGHHDRGREGSREDPRRRRRFRVPARL